MKIYVASSWRNTFQPEVVKALRSDGHQVYDFKEDGHGWGEGGHGPGGSWSEIDPDWKNWPNDVNKYIEGLNHPRAVEGFRRDMDALEKSDATVMVMPCGPSASMEMGWACGKGQLVCVYIPAIREPDLMVKMANYVGSDLDAIRNILLKSAPKKSLIQDRILAWFIANGGSATRAGAFSRMCVEVVELQREIFALNDHKAAEELADVVICANILAFKIGSNLEEAVNAKMGINEARKWQVSTDGTLSHIKGSDPRDTPTVQVR